MSGWEQDTLLFRQMGSENRDSLINALDYGEAKALVRGFED